MACLQLGQMKDKSLIQSALDLNLMDCAESTRCNTVSMVCTVVSSSIQCMSPVVACSCLLAKVDCSDINKSCDVIPLYREQQKNNNLQPKQFNGSMTPDCRQTPLIWEWDTWPFLSPFKIRSFSSRKKKQLKCHWKHWWAVTITSVARPWWWQSTLCAHSDEHFLSVIWQISASRFHMFPLIVCDTVIKTSTNFRHEAPFTCYEEHYSACENSCIVSSLVCL